ncbi:MAG TPA: DUF6787 family protein [Flavobacteriaceae bacterium]|nr:DUF6787 family protein [Flavobacteriaceae bacterium]
MKKLKERWGIDSNRRLFIILLVFAITGSLAAKLARPLVEFLDISRDSWYYWPVRILIILPVYKVILVIVGWIFGEFDFFYTFVKKMLNRMGLKFIKL